MDNKTFYALLILSTYACGIWSQCYPLTFYSQTVAERYSKKNILILQSLELDIPR